MVSSSSRSTGCYVLFPFLFIDSPSLLSLSLTSSVCVAFFSPPRKSSYSRGKSRIYVIRLPGRMRGVHLSLLFGPLKWRIHWDIRQCTSRYGWALNVKPSPGSNLGWKLTCISFPHQSAEDAACPLDIRRWFSPSRFVGSEARISSRNGSVGFRRRWV
jgi:hypothetical protein